MVGIIKSLWLVTESLPRNEIKQLSVINVILGKPILVRLRLIAYFFWFSFANRDLVYSEGRSRSPVQPASTWQTSGTASETSLPAR